MPSKPDASGSLRAAGNRYRARVPGPVRGAGRVRRCSDGPLLETTGTAAARPAYELRYSESCGPQRHASWWASAASAGAMPAPLTAGTANRSPWPASTPAPTYYFIIRTADEVPNWSGFSNVAAKSTATAETRIWRRRPVSRPRTWRAAYASAGTWSRRGARPATTCTAAPAPAGSATLVHTGALQPDELDRFGGCPRGRRTATASPRTRDRDESAPALATITVPGGSPPVATMTTFSGIPIRRRGRVTLRFYTGTVDGAPAARPPGRLRHHGAQVSRLLDDVVPAGNQTVDWLCVSDEGTPVAPGLYEAILDTPRAARWPGSPSFRSPPPRPSFRTGWRSPFSDAPLTGMLRFALPRAAQRHRTQTGARCERARPPAGRSRVDRWVRGSSRPQR